MQDFVDKTLRLVRISLLISAIQRVLRFFSESYFIKAIENVSYCLNISHVTLGHFSVSHLTTDKSVIFSKICMCGNVFIVLPPLSGEVPR